MTTKTAPPAGATHVCELRPRTEGGGFEVVSRARILGWQDGMPVTAYGVVRREAFQLSASDPRAGASFIEVRGADGTRRWSLPGQADSIPDGAVKKLLQRCAATPARKAAQPDHGFELSPDELSAVEDRVRATARAGLLAMPGQQARSAGGTLTVRSARAELNRLKDSLGMGDTDDR